MRVITRLFFIIAVAGRIRDAASVRNAKDFGGLYQAAYSVGKDLSKPGNRPAVFQMKFYKDGKVLRTCTGTQIMVHESRVLWLTAAECLDSQKYDELLIEYAFYWSFVRHSTRLREMSYKLHPYYNRVTKENNIAVITPHLQLYIDDRLRQSELPTSENHIKYGTADIYLRKKNDSKDAKMDECFELDSISTNIISPNWCKFWYPFSPIKNCHVCASGWNGLELPKIDIGMPLVTKGKDSMFKVIGIATIVRQWTRWFGLPIYEFLNIEPYAEWIRSFDGTAIYQQS